MEPITSSKDNNNDNNKSLVSQLKAYLWSLDFVEVLICIAGVLIPYYVIKTNLSTTQRPIPYQKLANSGDVVLNLTLNQPMADETFNEVVLYLGIVLGSFLLQLSLSLLKYLPGERHSTLCVYIVTVGITLIMTEILKRYVGYLRPHFYSECDLDTVTLTCQGDTKDSRKSFPSGHASTSFCCMTLLTLYLLGKFGISSVKRIQYHHHPQQQIHMEEAASSPRLVVYGQEDGNISTRNISSQHGTTDDALSRKKSMIWIRILSVFCLSPMLLAYIVAGSRVVNNYHHPADVVGGAVLGTGIAIFIHGIWYPPFDIL